MMVFQPGDLITITREVHVQAHVIAPGTPATYIRRIPFTFVGDACDVEIAGITGPYGYPFIAVSEDSIAHREPKWFIWPSWERILAILYSGRKHETTV